MSKVTVSSAKVPSSILACSLYMSGSCNGSHLRMDYLYQTLGPNIMKPKHLLNWNLMLLQTIDYNFVKVHLYEIVSLLIEWLLVNLQVNPLSDRFCNLVHELQALVETFSYIAIIDPALIGMHKSLVSQAVVEAAIIFTVQCFDEFEKSRMKD